MIQVFIDRFMAAKDAAIAEFQQKAPEDYDELVRRVVKLVAEPDSHGQPDAERITVIDHGNYQGTRLYIIAENGYQPSTYWSIFVNYGSCSGCDTFEAIREYSDEPPTLKKATEYWTMMLHMVQSMRQLNDGENDVEPSR